MNAAHLHLALNHAPLYGALFVAVLLIVAIARRSGELTRVALGLAVATSLITIPVYVSGESAEEIAESLPDVSTFLMDDHEEAALFSLVGLELCGVLALGGLVAYRKVEIPRWVAIAVLLATVASLGLTARTAYLGGQIRHSEVRPVP